MSRILNSIRFSQIKNKLFKTASIQASKFKSSSTSCSSKNKAVKKTFNTPHPPKDPPENYNPSCVEHDAFDVPEFIPAAAFRPFTSPSEMLGPGGDKCGCYRNPEYYAYHRYSFVTLQTGCLKLREELKKNAADCEAQCRSDDEKK